MCTRPFNIPYTGCVRLTNLESMEISSDENFEISKIRDPILEKKEEKSKTFARNLKKLENFAFFQSPPPSNDKFFARTKRHPLANEIVKSNDDEARTKDDGDFPSIHLVYVRSACVHLRRVFMERRAYVLRPPADNSAGAVRVTVTMQSTVETYRSIIPKLIFITRVPGRWRMAAHLSRPRAPSPRLSPSRSL